MTSSTSTTQSLRERVLASQAAAAHPEMVSGLGDGPHVGSTDTTVVVVGEKKRGKSSLINALVRRPGLLPVDVDIATSCYLGLRHGSDEAAVVYADEAPEGTPISLADIPEWASVEGNRRPNTAPPEPLHPGVSAVQVSLPDPLLARGLTLVDTPGVGGLEAGHTDITLAILRGADSLLFVVDPDSGFRKSELGFLAHATARVAHVAFVMTKVDRYPSWRDVLEENRRRLAEIAPAWQDSPWFEVSSLIAYDAVEAEQDGDDEEADVLWRESGLHRLAEYLRDRVAGHAGTLRTANDVHEIRSALTALEEAERVSLAAATGDPELRESLTEQQAALSTLLAENASWPTELGKALDEVRTDLQKAFRSRLRNARADLQDRVNADSVSLPALPSEVDAALRAAWIDLTTTLRQRLAAIVTILAGELAADGTDALSREFAYPDELTHLPELRELADGQRGMGDAVDEYMPVAFAAGGAYTLLTGMLAIVNPFTAVAIGVGAGLARRSAQTEKRRRAVDRSSGLSHLGRVFDQAYDDMGGDLQRAVSDARQELESTVRDLMTRRKDELEEQVRSLKQQVRADEATAAVLRKQSESRLAELADIGSALDEVASPARSDGTPP